MKNKLQRRTVNYKLYPIHVLGFAFNDWAREAATGINKKQQNGIMRSQSWSLSELCTEKRQNGFELIFHRAEPFGY
jgi:hypothetical protein